MAPLQMSTATDIQCPICVSTIVSMPIQSIAYGLLCQYYGWVGLGVQGLNCLQWLCVCSMEELNRHAVLDTVGSHFWLGNQEREKPRVKKKKRSFPFEKDLFIGWSEPIK